METVKDEELEQKPEENSIVNEGENRKTRAQRWVIE